MVRVYITTCCILFMVIPWFGCEEMPNAIDHTASVTLRVVDQSGFLEEYYGSNLVPNANINLRSVNYGVEYRIKTDESGVAVFNEMISDTYSCAVEARLSAEIVEAITGAPVERRLIGGESSIDVSAEFNDYELTITVDLAPLSDVVFSELYTTGPPGAGLYWHDKYVEIFNMADEEVYLDGIVIAWVRRGYITEPYIYSKQVWIFPGDGEDYPIYPQEFKVLATDAIDHTINAPESVDLSDADFEFYLHWGPDINNPDVPNMIPIYQPSGYDWLMPGEQGAFVLARVDDVYELNFRDDYMLIPKSDVIDGMEYLRDPSRLDEKILDPKIDAGATGGVQFYTGRSMERKIRYTEDGWTLENNNNSSLDFVVLDEPTPGYHHALPRD